LVPGAQFLGVNLISNFSNFGDLGQRSQRKFRIALLGVIATVAAAIGGGWAIHLSYRNSSIIATDSGVVNKDIQSSPVTHTVSGDINLGIQHKEQGDISIGIILEQYEAGLKRREQEVTEELKQAHVEDRQILEQEKSEIKRRLADIQTSYQSYVKELQERIDHLGRICGQVSDELPDQACAALAQSDQHQADRLFARIEAQTAAAVSAAAEAAYQRSRIALDQDPLLVGLRTRPTGCPARAGERPVSRRRG